MNRRGFLTSILVLGAAPAIVRASSLMPVRVLEPELIITDWPTQFRCACGKGNSGSVNQCFTCLMAETLRRNQHKFLENVARNNAMLATLIYSGPVSPGGIILPKDYSHG